MPKEIKSGELAIPQHHKSMQSQSLGIPEIVPQASPNDASNSPHVAPAALAPAVGPYVMVDDTPVELHNRRPSFDDGSVSMPNRQERKLLFGIDCADLVHFMHWEPGGEHVKNLVVKNVVMKTQKIKYKLPQTRYFSMEFPETQTLSAGMSWTIPITFRPVAKECYSDAIEFTTSFGKFFLPIKASLPEHLLEFPESIDFTLCPLRETAKRTFLMKNTGELTSYFEWEIGKPFCITPRSGRLPPGQSVTIVVEFKPQNASVFTATAVCNFGDKNHWLSSKVTKALIIYGIGKYSHLSIEGNTKTFDFGDVFVGKSLEKKFILQNPSAVLANFKIKQVERTTDPYFVFSTLAGSIGTQKKMEISIVFTPGAAGMVSTDYFDITTLSGNSIRIACTGRGVGPRVTLNTDVVNFNDVPANSTATRPLYIQNSSSTHAFYQFLSEPNSLFRVDKPWGVINPNSAVALTVKFSPTEPINYYRRVYCLVEHQDGIYVDFLGTCYNDKRRPATFHPKMISSYKERVKNGLWSHGPEHLEEMLKNGVIKYENGVLSYVDRSKQPPQSRPLDSPYDDYSIASEYFFEQTGVDQAVTLIDQYIDFGSCSRYRVIEPQFIRIGNNTRGKMSCVWHMPGESTGDDLTFVVTPKIADIQPKSYVEFKISFRPKMDNSFYGAQLECFVYFKSMRNFRLVNEETFTPPWCLTPMISGNTFPPGEDTFIPKINFGTTRLDFPSCHVDKSVYRTVRVSNTGDTPVKFTFMDIAGTGMTPAKVGDGSGGTDLSSIFSVKPRIGVLHKNESRLIVFRFNPNEQRVYEQALKCYFNSALSNSHDLHVRGVGHFPQIVFENQNTLCFKPTCIGTVASRTFVARNTSHIFVNFEWVIPKQYANFVAVEPVHGTLAPNSSSVLTCTFSPNTAKKWVLRLPCFYYHDVETIGSGSNDAISWNTQKRRTTLTIIGRGTTASIRAEPKLVDFGAVLINTAIEKEITITNIEECDIFYDLEIYAVEKAPEAEKREDEVDEDMEVSTDAKKAGAANPAQETCAEVAEIEQLVPNNIRTSCLEIQQQKDVLPARSNQVLKIRTRVREQVSHHFRVYYKMKATSTTFASINPKHVDSITPTQSQVEACKHRVLLFDIKVLGVYPLVKVTDIRCEGFSKSVLWQQLSIDHFNEIMDVTFPPVNKNGSTANVELDEEFNFPTDCNDSMDQPEQLSVDFNFGAAPVGTKPAVIHLSLMNPGVVSVDWIFFFPNDLEVEVENWADPGNYTEEQIQTNLILDNDLFTVSPKTGVLAPNESVHIIMTYFHTIPGSHKLPIIFKLKNGSTSSGKEVVLNFIGLTVAPEEKCLFFHSSRQQLCPVSIGTSFPPIQTFQLSNRGSVPLSYRIDMNSLQEMKTQQHNFEVFKILKEKGIIFPGGVEHIPCIFRPLEAIDYKVDVPIIVEEEQTHILTLSGKGIELLGPTSSIEVEDKIPLVQYLNMPKQVAILSLEHINFGNVPMGSLLRQILVVRNTLVDQTIYFRWILPKSLAQHSSVSVSPIQGSLKPSESRVCKLVFSPGRETRIYNDDIVCEIRTEMDQRKLEVMGISEGPNQNDDRNLQYDEPTNTNQPSIKSRRDSGIDGTGSEMKIQPILQRTKSRNDMPDIRNFKYRPLPDISPPKTPNSVDDSESGQKSGDGVGRKGSLRKMSARSAVSDFTDNVSVQEAAPSYLFLSIVAHVQAVDEYRKEFENHTRFFHPISGDAVSALSDDDSCNPDSYKVIESIMTGLLDDIVQDFDLDKLVDIHKTRPWPFFAQISSKSLNGIITKDEEAVVASNSDLGVEIVKDNKNEVTVKALDERILRSSEFQSIVESVLEGTVFNLMQEANLHEFDLTKNRFLVFVD
ncbi:hypothetical protein HDU76_008596 [Blyttiomyces sp. JEL0837]|nr:hypothetical protein HDU76_008596 [Blyttiomyces sp. JEL0837]